MSEKKIVQDVNLFLQINKLSDNKTTLPNTHVNGQISPIKIILTSMEYKLLLGIAKENLLDFKRHTSKPEALKPHGEAATSKESTRLDHAGTNFQLNVTLKYISLDLVRDEEDKNESSKRFRPMGNIVNLTINGLALSLSQFNSGSLKVV